MFISWSQGSKNQLFPQLTGSGVIYWNLPRTQSAPSSVTLASLLSTGFLGDLGPRISISPTSVAGVGQLGSLTLKAIQTLLGNSAVGAVGTLTINISHVTPSDRIIDPFKVNRIINLESRDRVITLAQDNTRII
jgi:hypothetical protein